MSCRIAILSLSCVSCAIVLFLQVLMRHDVEINRVSGNTCYEDNFPIISSNVTFELVERHVDWTEHRRGKGLSNESIRLVQCPWMRHNYWCPWRGHPAVSCCAHNEACKEMNICGRPVVDFPPEANKTIVFYGSSYMHELYLVYICKHLSKLAEVYVEFRTSQELPADLRVLERVFRPHSRGRLFPFSVLQRRHILCDDMWRYWNHELVACDLVPSQLHTVDAYLCGNELGVALFQNKAIAVGSFNNEFTVSPPSGVMPLLTALDMSIDQVGIVLANQGNWVDNCDIVRHVGDVIKKPNCMGLFRSVKRVRLQEDLYAAKFDGVFVWAGEFGTDLEQTDYRDVYGHTYTTTQIDQQYTTIAIALNHTEHNSGKYQCNTFSNCGKGAIGHHCIDSYPVDALRIILNAIQVHKESSP